MTVVMVKSSVGVAHAWPLLVPPGRSSSGEGEQILGAVSETFVLSQSRCRERFLRDFGGLVTKDKDFKAVVRSRAAASGERYTEVRERMLAGVSEPDRPLRRVWGLETRYRLVAELMDQRPLSSEEVTRYLFRQVVSRGRSSNVYLENGALMYLAAGGVVEYATPECDSVAGAVAHVRAGHARMRELVDSTQARLREEGTRGSIRLLADRSAQGGSHESYLLRHRLSESVAHSALTPFLATRSLITGTGGIVTSEDRELFVLAPRAELHEPTQRINRAMFLDQARAFAGEHSVRLHLQAGDTNRAQVAEFLKIGTTALTVRLLERDPSSVPDLRLESARTATRQYSHDITGTRGVALASGQTASALNVQRVFLAAAQRLAAEEPTSDEERGVLSLWSDALDAVERQNHDRLGRWLDWAAKLTAIRADALTLADPEAAAIDAAFAHLHPSDGPASGALEGFETVVRQSDVDHAMRDAPTTTRANMRGAFIKACTAARRDYTVDWTHLKLNDQARRTIIVNDPLEATNDRVDKLLAEIAERSS